MNIPYIEKYMEDLTGVAKTNLVKMEPFTIRADGRDPIKTAQAGLFYADSLKVYDKDGNELVKWWDYKPIYIFPEATKYTGQSVTGFVQILNTELKEGGFMTYQVVGGHWSYVSQLLVDLLWAAIIDTRNVFYDNVLNKPSLFPPSYHTHSITRTIGWEARIGLVERIIDEIIVKADDARAEYLLKHVDSIREYVDARYDEITEWLSDHKNNSHAHGETETTVGIANLDNLRTATLGDAVEGKRTDVRLTVAGMKALVNKNAVNGSDKFIHNGILPITRYGSLHYIVPSIRGNYEGSSQWNPQDARVCIEESDGTLIRLRPGTNGTSIGVYYDYMYGAFTDANANFIRTNDTYWPSDMGLWRPLTTRRSTTDLVWGIAYNSTGFPTLTTKGFVSVTNGTFDQTKHTSAFFSMAFDHPQFGTKTISTRAMMMVSGGYVYCFDVQYWGSGNPMGVVILRTPLSGITGGATVVFEVMAGITNTGGPFGTVVGAGAFITPKTNSTAANDTAMFSIPVGLSLSYPHSGWNFYVEDAGDGTIRLVFGGYIYLSTSNSDLINHVGWRCTINPTTKRVNWVDSPKQMRYSLDASNKPVLTANDATKITHIKLATDNEEKFNEHGVNYISKRTGSFLKSVCWNEVNSDNRLVFGKITNWNPTGSNWDVANRVIQGLRQIPDATEFGSEINNLLRDPVGLPNGYITLNNNNTNNLPVSVCVKYTGNENYAYNIVNTGTVNGYGPTTDRTRNGRNPRNRYISYWDGTKLSVKGGILTPWAVSTTSDVNPNGSEVDTNQVRWNVNELNTAALNFANTLSIASNVITAHCDIVVHSDPAVPILAIVVITHRTGTNTATASVYVTKVNYTGARTGLITGYSLVTTGYLSTQYANSNVIGLWDGSAYQAGCCVYRAGNYLMITLASSSVVTVVGNRVARSCNLVYNITTGTLEIASWPVVSGNPNFVTYWPTILEGVGLVVVDTVAGESSIGTVLMMLPMGNTRDGFKAFDYTNKTNRFVLAAQEVKQGSLAYFTESQPLILNGREGVAPAMSIDLSTIVPDPTNRTFYVYVIDNNGSFTHQISATPLPVGNTRAYLGTLRTNAVKIESTDIQKITRIGNYQLSLKKVGGSIPVSSGPYTELGDWVIENI